MILKTISRFFKLMFRKIGFLRFLLVAPRDYRSGKKFWRLAIRSGWIERSQQESSVLSDAPLKAETIRSLKESFRLMQQLILVTREAPSSIPAAKSLVSI